VDPERALHLAQLVLAVHLCVASFVVFGLVAIPLGAARGWPFVHALAWRAPHLAVVMVIALQKVLGRTCFLGVWEEDYLNAAGSAAQHMPLAQVVAIDVMHWDLPLWFFTVLYSAVLLYTLVLWRLVPPRTDQRA
jgi:hypothetical protein